MKTKKPPFTVTARSANELIGDLEWASRAAIHISKEFGKIKEEEAWAFSGNIKELARRLLGYAKQIKKQKKP